MFDSVQLLGFNLLCSLTLIHSLYVISVRQTRVLPPSSFRFHLTMDTLDFGCILPTVGRIRDFHPLETCAAERTKVSAALQRIYNDCRPLGGNHLLSPEPVFFICSALNKLFPTLYLYLYFAISKLILLIVVYNIITDTPYNAKYSNPLKVFE